MTIYEICIKYLRFEPLLFIYLFIDSFHQFEVHLLEKLRRLIYYTSIVRIEF